MYSLGQTLWDKKNKEIVLYLGITSYKNMKLFYIIKRKDGAIEFPSSKQITHISDKNGKPVTGKHSIDEYFGLLGEHKETVDLFPDESITPDGKNFFVDT